MFPTENMLKPLKTSIYKGFSIFLLHQNHGIFPVSQLCFVGQVVLAGATRSIATPQDSRIFNVGVPP